MPNQTSWNEVTGSIVFDNAPGEAGGRQDDPIPGSLLAEALDDVSFPTSKDELVAQVGRRRLRFANGQSIALTDLLYGVRTHHFESAGEVIDALRHPTQEDHS
jgi:hypothetical protein